MASISSDELIDHHLCSVCKKQGKITQADKYCVDCPDYYCLKCADNIHIAPALAIHKLIAKDEADDGETLPSVPTSRCSRHRFRIIDMYCRDHDQVGCTTCMAVDQKSNCHVFDIPEFVQTNSGAVHEYLQSVKDVETELKTYLRRFQEEQEMLLLNKHAVIGKINKLRAKFEIIIRKATEDAIGKVEKEFNNLYEEFSNKIMTLNDEIKQVEEKYYQLNSCLFNLPEAFVLTKKSKECIPKAKKVNCEMNRVELDRMLRFVSNTVYDSILNNTETSLGNVLTNPYSFTKEGDVDMSLLKDRNECRIYDSCCSMDGSLFFTDRSNKLLIRVCCENMKIIEHFDFPPSPLGVCCISDNRIAVCLGWKVQILNIRDKIRLDKSFPTTEYCFGLSCHDDMLYAASENHVFKYNIEGTLLESYGKDSGGNNVFTDIQTLVVNPLSKNIHITDNERGVITIDMKGRIVNIIKDEFKGPRGICVDEYGYVFVSCFYPDNIILINSKGTYIKTIITKASGLYGPGALCFDVRTGKLCVGNNLGKELTVFGLNFSIYI